MVALSTGVLLLLGLLAVLAGVMRLVKPRRWLPLRTRGLGIAAVGGGLLLVLLGVTLAPQGFPGIHKQAGMRIPGKEADRPVAETVAASSPTLTVSVIDVGQGDAILVQFPNGQQMLVDAGDREHGDDVVRYLRGRGVTRIDLLVATHPHEDHIGGMAAVLAAFPIGKVWDSGYVHGSRTQEEFLRQIKAKGIRYGAPRAGFTQDVGDARIAVLAPVRLLADTDADANNNSLVLQVRYGSTSFLLAGDMEKAERATVRAWPSATVLKVAHHGSRNGADPAFLARVKPKIAVISYAKGNPYGHPHAETLSALRGQGVTVYTTAQHGTVLLTSDSKNVTAKVSTPPAAAPPAATAARSYIGNRNTKVFHRPSCSYLPAPQNRVYFQTRQAAVRAGYRPCQKCKP